MADAFGGARLRIFLTSFARLCASRICNRPCRKVAEPGPARGIVHLDPRPGRFGRSRVQDARSWLAGPSSAGELAQSVTFPCSAVILGKPANDVREPRLTKFHSPFHRLEPLCYDFSIFAGIKGGDPEESFSLSAESCPRSDYDLDLV